jgi:hypothetical protein
MNATSCSSVSRKMRATWTNTSTATVATTTAGMLKIGSEKLGRDCSVKSHLIARQIDSGCWKNKRGATLRLTFSERKLNGGLKIVAFCRPCRICLIGAAMRHCTMPLGPLRHSCRKRIHVGNRFSFVFYRLKALSSGEAGFSDFLSRRTTPRTGARQVR